MSTNPNVQAMAFLLQNRNQNQSFPNQSNFSHNNLQNNPPVEIYPSLSTNHTVSQFQHQQTFPYPNFRQGQQQPYQQQSQEQFQQQQEYQKQSQIEQQQHEIPIYHQQTPSQQPICYSHPNQQTPPQHSPHFTSSYQNPSPLQTNFLQTQPTQVGYASTHVDMISPSSYFPGLPFPQQQQPFTSSQNSNSMNTNLSNCLNNPESSSSPFLPHNNNYSSANYHLPNHQLQQKPYQNSYQSKLTYSNKKQPFDKYNPNNVLTHHHHRSSGADKNRGNNRNAAIHRPSDTSSTSSANGDMVQTVIEGVTSITSASVTDGSALYCESCERDFPNAIAMEAHMKSHSKCTHPGCSFTATQKIVSNHFQSKHVLANQRGLQLVNIEGQEFRVLMGIDPQEVSQWREARRKNFPSKENIEIKQEKIQQVIDAGGIGDLPKPMTGKRKKNEDRDKNNKSNRVNKKSKPSTMDKYKQKEDMDEKTGISNTTTSSSSSSNTNGGDMNSSNQDVTTNPTSLPLSTDTESSNTSNILPINDDMNGDNPEVAITSSSHFVSGSINNNKGCNKRICRYFFTKSGCNIGDECAFSHVRKNNNNNMNKNNNNNNKAIAAGLASSSTSSSSSVMITELRHQEEEKSTLSTFAAREGGIQAVGTVSCSGASEEPASRLVSSLQGESLGNSGDVVADEECTQERDDNDESNSMSNDIHNNINNDKYHNIIDDSSSYSINSAVATTIQKTAVTDTTTTAEVVALIVATLVDVIAANETVATVTAAGGGGSSNLTEYAAIMDTNDNNNNNNNSSSNSSNNNNNNNNNSSCSSNIDNDANAINTINNTINDGTGQTNAKSTRKDGSNSKSRRNRNNNNRNNQHTNPQSSTSTTATTLSEKAMMTSIRMPTLLQQLLNDQINAEDSFILQCLHILAREKIHK